MSFAGKVLGFYAGLQIKEKLPKGVDVLNPYQDKNALDLCRQFYEKYFNDDNRRLMIIGINPGRHGAGLTGIPFTDPVKLEEVCGITNDLPKKAELSADFIHAMIRESGGIVRFFSKFYFTSVSPLGFTQGGVNLNYYDHAALAKKLRPFIITSLRTQLSFGIDNRKAFCLGEGSNFKFLSALNKEEELFEEIIPLAHPRFIMQYRRKFVNDHIKEYISKLNAA